MLKDTKSIFEREGGEFISPLSVIAGQLQQIKVYIFDWDGVFNDGTKHQEYGSPFSEVDAMGTNMLRFSHFMRTGEVPLTMIVSGEKNLSARTLAERERFDRFYFKTSDKSKALTHLQAELGTLAHEICFVYDDILDLSLANEAGLRMMVRHTGNPLFRQYVTKRRLAHYVSGSVGGQGAVREICELLIQAGGSYNAVIEERIAFSELYQEYLSIRQAKETTYYTLKEGNIIKA